jgi:hypothetical protein
MDFDIGNIFYVVITLVAVIVGLLGRKKKTSSKGSESGEGGSKSQPGFLESLENMLKMDQEEPGVMDLRENESDLLGEDSEQEAYETVQQPVAETAQTPQSPMGEYEQILERLQSRGSEMTLTEMDTLTEPLELISLEEEEGTDYFEIIKDFDAGTAIVYSAIINRVEY